MSMTTDSDIKLWKLIQCNCMLRGWWVVRAIYDAKGRLFSAIQEKKEPKWIIIIRAKERERKIEIWITWLIELFQYQLRTIQFCYYSISNPWANSSRFWLTKISISYSISRCPTNRKSFFFVENCIDCAANSSILCHEPQSQFCMYQFAQKARQ